MEWYYAIDGQQRGPVAEAQLDELVRSGSINQNTLVWRNGMAQWQPLQSARPELAPPAQEAPPIGTPCTECQKLFPQSEMIQLNQAWVCAQCKPIYLQRLVEGVAPGVGGGSLWRNHRHVVFRPGATFPDRCVRCNAPVSGHRLKRQLYWHPPGYYLLILVSLLIYIIVALIIRKKALIHIGLCAEHRKQRFLIIAGSWLAVVLGVILLFVGINVHGAYALAGVVLFLAGALYGGIKGPVVAAARIDQDVVRVKGAGPAFLESLPEWPDSV